MVAFGAVGPSSAGAGNTSTASLSWTHTGQGLLLVGCAVDNATDGGLTATATCDSVSMTSLGRVESDAQTAGFLQVWQIAGLASAAHAVVVTVTGGPPADLEGGSLSFTGASGLGAPVTNSGTSVTASAAVTANAAGNLIAAFTGVGDTIVSSGNTSRFIKNNVGGAGNAVGNAAGSTASATGSTVTMSWTLTSAADPWAVLAVEVQGAVIAAQPFTGGKTWRRRRRRYQRWSFLTAAPVSQITITDAGSADDTGLAVAAAVPLADTGTGADTLAVTAAISLAESGTGTDSIASGVAISLADAGTGTDTLAVTAAPALADAGSSAETFTVTAAVPLAESGTGAQSVTIAAAVPLADGGTGADTLAVQAATNIALAEAGTAADTLALTAVTTANADTGTGTDTLAVLVALALADAGTALDTLAFTIPSVFTFGKALAGTGAAASGYTGTSGSPSAAPGSGSAGTAAPGTGTSGTAAPGTSSAGTSQPGSG